MENVVKAPVGRDKPDFGPAVSGGTLRYTSASAIQAFDVGTYAGCNLRWYFTRVEKCKEPENKGQQTGKDGHSQIEHYLRTNEDVLGPFARAGKHFLPTPGSDLVVEQGLAPEAETKIAMALAETGAPQQEIERMAGLAIEGVPIVGYVDVRHSRGQYVAGDATLKWEESPATTIEVIDHKFTSDIARYSKTAEQILDAVQMVSYAVHAGNINPNADRVRLSHNYYATKGPKTARKVTGLILLEDARRKWYDGVGPIVRAMKDVAKAKNASEVEGYSPSCDAYRGCPHRAYCPHTPDSSIFDIWAKKPTGENLMAIDLFASSATNGVPAVPLPPVPSMSEAQWEEKRQAERIRLSTEDVVPPAITQQPASIGTCQHCAEPLTIMNASKLLDGIAFKHIGCQKAPGRLPPAPPSIGAVNPPDQPPYDPVAAADPLPPDVVASMQDPALRERATLHAQEHAARQAVIAAAKPEKKASGRCSAGGQVLVLTDKEKITRLKTCPECGVERKIKDNEFSPDFTAWVVPKHNLPKAAPLPLAPPLPPINTSAHLPPPPPPITATVHVDVVPSGITLYVDVVHARGPQPKSLDAWYRDILKRLEEHYSLVDIRIVNKDHELAFGRWRAAIAAVIKVNIPSPGEYVIYGGSQELVSAFVEGLSPHCERVILGSIR